MVTQLANASSHEPTVIEVRLTRPQVLDRLCTAMPIADAKSVMVRLWHFNSVTLDDLRRRFERLGLGADRTTAAVCNPAMITSRQG